MIDLTPLDVRNKRGDFDKNLRGYDPQEVDTFLELVAERLEELVMQNLQLRERTEGLQKQVDSQTGREHAVQEALVTAQELRSQMKDQAQRESALVLEEARTEGRRLVVEAEAEVRTLLRNTERKLEEGKQALEELERRRTRFLKGYRQLLEREMDVVEVEEGREPLEIQAIELNLGGGRRDAPDFSAPVREPEPQPEARHESEPRADAELPPEPATDPLSAPKGDVAETEAAAEDDALVSRAADEVRGVLAGLDAEDADEAVEWVRQKGEPVDDETLSLSFEESPDESADPDDERWG